MDIQVLFSLYVWIRVTDIWCQFHVNSPIRKTFTEKNVDATLIFPAACVVLLASLINSQQQHFRLTASFV